MLQNYTELKIVTALCEKLTIILPDLLKILQ